MSPYLHLRERKKKLFEDTVKQGKLFVADYPGMRAAKSNRFDVRRVLDAHRTQGESIPDKVRMRKRAVNVLPRNGTDSAMQTTT